MKSGSCARLADGNRSLGVVTTTVLHIVEPAVVSKWFSQQHAEGKVVTTKKDVIDTLRGRDSCDTASCRQFGAHLICQNPEIRHRFNGLLIDIFIDNLRTAGDPLMDLIEDPRRKLQVVLWPTGQFHRSPGGPCVLRGHAFTSLPSSQCATVYPGVVQKTPRPAR